ncbi:MAG: hypothetical protein ACXAC5_01870 [Promethearchaeota archaeon]|jgi:hypothetical protein
MILSPTSDCCYPPDFHPPMCIRKETTIEMDETEQPDGSVKVDAAIVEIEHCTNCNTVLRWEPIGWL